jgi:hypothetical protein
MSTEPFRPLLVILSAWVPPARWLIVPLLVVFLTPQLLRYIIHRRPDAAGSASRDQDAGGES